MVAPAFDTSRPISRLRVASAPNEATQSIARSLDALEQNLLSTKGSLRSEHEEYVSAVRFFEESAVELLKMFKDGRDDHMLAAYPKSQQGSDKIREVGGKFWPNEFPAN